MTVISISSGISGYSRSEDLRPRQVSMKTQEALASKTLTYDEQEEINKFQDVIDGLSSEDQEAVETYLEETLEKMRKGETDMTALAADAPDALKAAMEAEGLDLSSVLKSVSQHSPEAVGAVDMQVDENISIIQQVTASLDEEDQAAANKYMQDVMDKMHSGKFDVDELADNAPTALANALKEQEADLKSMLESMNSKFLSVTAATDYSTVLFSKLSSISIDLGPDDKAQA